METIKKIVVIGPESTGKSTLCAKLAAHYNTLWVPEYAREYLEKNGAEYNYDDLLTIAKGQIELEESRKYQVESSKNQVESSKFQTGTSNPKPQTSNLKPQTSNLQPKTSRLIPQILFIDTDMYVMKVWSEFVFNSCHNWILNRIAERKYDLYLLCDTGLPWVEDVLREYPDEKIRKKLFHFYKDAMINQSTPWCIISGIYEERFDGAIKFIEDSFTKKNVQK